MKEIRFRKPDFQKSLARARRFSRKTPAEGAPRSRFIRYLALGVLVVIFYFLTVSSMLVIDEVAVAGSGIIDIEAVAEALEQMSRDRIYLIPASHILIINQKRLLTYLQKELPQIRTLTKFKRVFPDRIEIAIEERQPLYVWQSKDSFYLLDQDGVVFQKITNYNPAAYSQDLITDTSGSEVRVGQELRLKKALGFIEQIKNDFTSFSLPGVRSLDIFAKTSIGFEVYFDLDRSAAVQLMSLDLLLSREIKPETLNGLSYIDLRLPDIAYYCYKDAPCATSSP